MLDIVSAVASAFVMGFSRRRNPGDIIMCSNWYVACCIERLIIEPAPLLSAPRAPGGLVDGWDRKRMRWVVCGCEVSGA